MNVKIYKIKKSGKKYIVYTSEDEEGIKLTEDAIVNNRIIKDAEFLKEDWERIKSGKDIDNLFDKALGFISFKPRTKKEVIDYLQKKQADEDTIYKVCEKLENIHYLDDDKYAKMYIEESIRNKKGPYLIKHSLIELGIIESIINKYLQMYSDEIQFENACLIAKKYQNTKMMYPPLKQKELIYQKLLRSGFYSETISKVVANLDFSCEFKDMLYKEYKALKQKQLDDAKIINKLMQKGYSYSDIKEVLKK